MERKKMRHLNMKMALMGLALIASAACGGDDEKTGVSIDRVTATQALTANTQDVTAKVSGAIGFLQDSNLANRGFSLIAPSTDCVSVDGGSGADFDTADCVSDPVELDVDLNAPATELTDYLTNQIFADGNIESESDRSVTYLLRGAVVCTGDSEIAPDPDCVDQVDQAQIRLKVTSPQDGDVDVDVLIGPQKANPLSIEIHQTMLAAEIDLGGLKGAIRSLTNDDPSVELPSTMQGRIRGEVEVLGAQKARVAVSVLTDIKVAGADYEVGLGKSAPALELVADGVAKTLTSTANLGAMSVKAPYSTEVYSDLDGSYTEVSHVLDVAIAGLSSSLTLSGDTDTLTITNIGLGDATSVIKVDGSQVIGIDLNADAGRKLAATITGDATGTTIAVDPKFDLALAMDFSVLADDPDADFPAWAMGETMRVTLDGANPSIRISEETEAVEVLSGALKMELATAGDAISVAAGQCLLQVAQEPTPIDSPDPAPVTEDNGPFSGMESGACPM